MAERMDTVRGHLPEYISDICDGFKTLRKLGYYVPERLDPIQVIELALTEMKLDILNQYNDPSNKLFDLSTDIDNDDVSDEEMEEFLNEVRNQI